MNTMIRRGAGAWMALLALLCALPLAAAEPADEGRPCQVESSLWMLMNLGPDPADFYQLSLGYALGEKDVVYLNAMTWKYAAPLGIPFGPDWESPAEDYPGYVRAFGLGLGYQRFLWRGLFASLYATPFLQEFHAVDGSSLGSGFQLFFQGMLGYQVELFRGRAYLKPSLSFNYWPVNTDLPASFRLKEEAWPDYFLFEPHLNVGFRF